MRKARRASRELEEGEQGDVAAAKDKIVKEQSRPLSTSSRGALGQRFDPLLHETVDGGMVHPPKLFAWHEKGQKKKQRDEDAKLWRQRQYGIRVEGDVAELVWLTRGWKKKAKARKTSPLNLPPL